MGTGTSRGEMLRASAESGLPAGSRDRQTATVPASGLIRGSSPPVRAMRLAVLPLLLLAVGGLLPTELHWVRTQDLILGAIADVIYLGHGAFGLIHGHVPYAPHFMTYPDQRLTYLYPPLTLLITLPPVLAGKAYTAAFSLEMLLLALVGAWLLGRHARRLGAIAPVGPITFVMLLATGPVLLTRVDGVQGLLVGGSCLALIRGRRSWAIALVALACLVKETAVLAAVPVGLWCLLPDPDRPDGLGTRLKEIGVGLLPALAIFSAFLVWSHGAEVTSALASVHRAMEIESVAASLAIALSHFFPVHPYLGKLASWELRTSDASLLALLATLGGGCVITVGSLLFARQHRRPATAIAFAVAVGLCATPVLSPQYLLDLVPVLVLACCLELPRRWAERLLWMLLAALLLTQAEFPYLFIWVVRLEPGGVLLLFARNALLVLIAAALLWRVPRRERLQSLPA